MTEINDLKVLLKRCTQEAEKYCDRLGLTAEMVTWLAWRAAGQLHKNLHTRKKLGFSTVEDIPGDYLQGVITSLHREMPRWVLLKQHDDDSWEQVRSFVRSRVARNLAWMRRRRQLDFNAWVEDCTHDIVLRIYRKLDSFPFDSALDAWITVIASRHMRSLYRKRVFGLYVNMVSLDFPIDTPQGTMEMDERICDVSADQQYAVAELLRFLEQAKELLTPRERTVMHLLVIEGRSPKEVAAQLGITTNSVHQFRSMARRKLRAFSDL